MLAGSNPAARTSQSQSPRSPYRGAGRLFSYSVRQLDGFSLTPNHEMRFSSFRAFPPIQSRYTQLSISPPFVPFSRAAASEDSMRSIVPLPYSVWRDATSPLASPRPLSDGRGGSAHAPLHASLSVQSASRLPPRLAFRRAARCLPYYQLSYTAGGEGGVFFARISVFPVDSAAVCDTLIDIHAGVVERQTRQI